MITERQTAGSCFRVAITAVARRKHPSLARSFFHPLQTTKKHGFSIDLFDDEEAMAPRVQEKRVMTKIRFQLIALGALLAGLGGLFAPGPTGANTILDFSDFSSDVTFTSDPAALVTVTGSEGQLTIHINSAADFEIAQPYLNANFDITPQLVSGFASPNCSEDSQAQTVDGLCKYNSKDEFGSGNKPPSAELTTMLIHNITMTTLLEATIGSKLSTIPPDQLRALAATTSGAGPLDEGAFGTTTTVMPEPGILALVGSGMVAVGLWGRKKFVGTKA